MEGRASLEAVEHHEADEREGAPVELELVVLPAGDRLWGENPGHPQNPGHPRIPATEENPGHPRIPATEESGPAAPHRLVSVVLSADRGGLRLGANAVRISPSRSHRTQIATALLRDGVAVAVARSAFFLAKIAKIAKSYWNYSGYILFFSIFAFFASLRE